MIVSMPAYKFAFNINLEYQLIIEVFFLEKERCHGRLRGRERDVVVGGLS